MHFITSDIHFGHKGIMSFCPVSRAFGEGDVVKMDEEIIKRWNRTVSPKDHTYILGDFAFCNAEKAVSYLQRLNGAKTLVIGNHDVKLIKNEKFRDELIEMHDYMSIQVNGTKVIMFHYPIAEWDQMHRGAVHFHGHLHGSVSGLEEYRALDVGMDNNECTPWKLEDAIAHALKGKIKGHHQIGI
jgi:calcineurin-like phosphoesterase family protein